MSGHDLSIHLYQGRCCIIYMIQVNPQMFPSVISSTSLSVCQLHDLSGSQSKHDSTWKSVCMSVYPSSIPSFQPSAQFMVKVPRSIAGKKYPVVHLLEKSLPSVHHWINLLYHQAVCHPLHHHHLRTH